MTIEWFCSALFCSALWEGDAKKNNNTRHVPPHPSWPRSHMFLLWIALYTTSWLNPPFPHALPNWGRAVGRSVCAGPLDFEGPAAMRWHARKHAPEFCTRDDALSFPVECYRDRLERLRIDLAYWFVGRRTPGFRVVRLARQSPRNGAATVVGAVSYVIDVSYDDDAERLRLVLRERPDRHHLTVVTLYRLHP